MRTRNSMSSRHPSAVKLNTKRKTRLKNQRAITTVKSQSQNARTILKSQNQNARTRSNSKDIRATTRARLKNNSIPYTLTTRALPPELYQTVLNILNTNKDLKVIRLVSRELNSLCQQMMWHTPKLTVRLDMDKVNQLAAFGAPIRCLKLSNLVNLNKLSVTVRKFVHCLLGFFSLTSFELDPSIWLDCGGRVRFGACLSGCSSSFDPNLTSFQLRALLQLPVTHIHTCCVSRIPVDRFIEALEDAPHNGTRPSVTFNSRYHSWMTHQHWARISASKCCHVREIRADLPLRHYDRPWKHSRDELDYTDCEYEQYVKSIARLSPAPYYSVTQIVNPKQIAQLRGVRLSRLLLNNVSILTFGDKAAKSIRSYLQQLIATDQRPILDINVDACFASFQDLKLILTFPLERLDTSWFRRGDDGDPTESQVDELVAAIIDCHQSHPIRAFSISSDFLCRFFHMGHYQALKTAGLPTTKSYDIMFELKRESPEILQLMMF